VVGDTDLGGSVGGDPLAVIARNGSTGRIKSLGLAPVYAGTDINIRKTQAGDVDIVEANGRHLLIS
jgi:hypothetical protein